ncbi:MULTISPECIES: retropepsin-like aspartic protease [Chitinophagaceae]
MKKFNYFVFFLLLCVSTVLGQNATLTKMNDLLAKKDFFALAKVLSVADGSITPQDSLYFLAATQNAFGENQNSIATIRALSDHYATQIDDNAWMHLLNILADDYTKNYDYKSATACYAILLRKYSSVLTKDDIDSYTNSYQLYKSLENIPAQTVTFSENVPVQMSPDQESLWNVPIVVNDQDSVHFIFDSGAGISTITTSAAHRLGLQIIPANIKVDAANDHQVLAQLGIADVLKIGGAVFHHVVFLVMDDRLLNFPSIKYQINGIIGFPVIHAMHNITITRGGLLWMNQMRHREQPMANFYYQGNAIKMLGLAGKDTLLFHLDTGAKQSELGKDYYNANSSYIRSVSEKKKYHLGSAGGVTSYKTFQLPNFSVQIGTGKATLPYIPVYPNKVSPYGNAIGQDYIGLFGNMVIDFDRCYITFQ